MAGVSGAGKDGVVALPAGPASQPAVLLRKRRGARWESPAGRDDLLPHRTFSSTADTAPFPVPGQ